MFFLDFHILLLQIMPPHWRFKRFNNGSFIQLNPTGKFLFLKSVTEPFKYILNQIQSFRFESRTKINLTGQTIVVENHIREITGEIYGVYIADGQVNQFELYVPSSASSFEPEIIQFLNKVIPAGRIYTINFY